MPLRNPRSILKQKNDYKIPLLNENEAFAESNHEKESDLLTKLEDMESNHPKVKHSKRKPFTCPVAIFDENQDPNKKPMYPKHLVYAAEGKDVQLEEIRAMMYWNKVKGTGENIPSLLCREKSKTTTHHNASTQTESEIPKEAVQNMEISTQTDNVFPITKEITTQTDEVTESTNQHPTNESPKADSRRVTTRSLARAKLTSKIPAALTAPKNSAKKEPSVIPTASSVTFIIPKQGKNDPTVDLKKLNCQDDSEKSPVDKHSNSDDDADANDSELNTRAFKVVPSSTPFQFDRNKNKCRRKTTRIELP